MVKVLVIRFSSLGDVVLTVPVLHALRDAWPQARLTMLVKEEFADIVAGNPALNEWMVLRRGESLFSLVRRVRADHFDMVIDLHSNIRSRIVSFFSGAARRVRYRKAALARRLYVRWRFPSAELKRHTLERYLDTLRRLGIHCVNDGAKEPNKILVIQTAFLGDAVLTTPLLTALREHFPQATLTVVCTPEIVDVFQRHPAVSDVILFDKRGRDRSWWTVWRLAQTLQARGFDRAYLPHRSLTSALLAWLAQIPRRIGFSSSQGRWLLTDVVPFAWGVHDADRNLSLLKGIGVAAGSGKLGIQPDPEARQTVVERLRSVGVASQDILVGVNAGSVWATKRWLPEGFAAVSDRLIRERGVKVIFFGGDRDRETVEAVLKQMQEKAINWVGQTNLRELIAGIARCNAFLTNDSGPMHVAVACRVPTVALFGPTTRELGFFPYGDGHIVIEKDLACRPCGLHGARKCPLEHFHCMKWITPEEVFGAVQKLLERAA